jgi:hypothetical protein
VRNCAQILPANERLYALEYDTFEDYCQKRWGMSRQHAYRQIDATIVSHNLSPIGDNILKPNESQARLLARLEPEEQDTSLLMLQKL